MAETPPVIIKLHVDENSPAALEFFYWLGRCVAAWAYLDRQIYRIFSRAIGLEQEQTAFMYYRNRAANQRLRIADDAVKMFLPKPVYDAHWTPLRERIAELSHTRNILAHHPTKRLGTSRDGLPIDIFSVYIEPFERVLNNDYPGLKGKDELLLEDLKQHDQDVQDLESKLGDFAWHMAGEREARKIRAARLSDSPKDTPSSDK